MRNVFANYLSQKAKKNKKIYFVVADISPAGNLETFKKNFRGRFINVGVSEQAMIGISAGLALNKKIPFAYTIATFSLYRPFEMVRVDLCYQNLPVTVVGMGAGTIYSTLGGTHLTQEDISIARSLPNMKILAPCDPEELKECLNYCINNKKGPIYLRIGKSGEPNLTKNSIEKWKFGKIRKLVNGQDFCVLTYGTITRIAFELKNSLEKKNKSTSIYSVHTLKPMDTKRLNQIEKKYKKIIVIEDHSEIGGLASICKENFINKSKLITFSLKDKFIHNFGSQSSLLDDHGISLKKILKKIKLS